MSRLLKIAAVGALLFLFRTEGLAEEAGAGYVVIVNGANPASSMSKNDVSRMFLRKITKFEASGEDVNPVDQLYTNDVTERFCEGVHGRSTDWLRSYWRKQVFSGRGYPPQQVKSDDEVIAFVSEHAGGIGYVTAEATLPEGVKALAVE